MPTKWARPEHEQVRPAKGAPFQFVSSYRGEHDFEHKATGRRLVWESGRALRWSDWNPVEGAILVEWDSWQADEEARFRAWCERRGLPFPDGLGIFY